MQPQLGQCDPCCWEGEAGPALTSVSGASAMVDDRAETAGPLAITGYFSLESGPWVCGGHLEGSCGLQVDFLFRLSPCHLLE